MFVIFASSSPKDTAWPPLAFALLPAIVIFLVGLVGSILYVWWLKNTSHLIRIALNEGDIDRALQLLKGMAKRDIHGYTYNNRYGYYGFGDIALQVARAAEEARPREAIELYRQSAERLIALRGRQNYQEACKSLAKMRALYEKLGEHEAWTTYMTALREQNRNLRALREELEIGRA